MKLRELQKIITKGDKTFTQIEASPAGYIYEVSDSEVPTLYYEVFKRVERPDFDFDTKKKIEGQNYIVYPSSSKFGYGAKCIIRNTNKESLKAAHQYFKTLKEND